MTDLVPGRHERRGSHEAGPSSGWLVTSWGIVAESDLEAGEGEGSHVHWWRPIDAGYPSFSYCVGCGMVG